MKNIIKKSLQQLLADRLLFAVLILLLLVSIISSIIVGLSIHFSELQLVSHYSAYGVTHLYRDQWFYLIVFVAFELVTAILHIIISIKLLLVKDRSIAIMFAWIGVGVVLFGLIVALSILNVWKPL